MDISGLTIKKARELLDKKQLSAVELAKACLDRIKEVDSDVGAFITVCEDMVLAAAEKSARIQGPLAGIPVALKDNICTKGIRTTCASRMLESYIPPYSATVVEKLEKAGAVILGKTNMDEFAMGSTTETSYFRKTRNPHDLSRVPGGSSGGSAAAVAANLCLGALGSDTGGSIRQPAAFCGVVGLKPTYGLVSRYGLIAFASSLDQIGPMAKTSADCALLLDAISGRDPMDGTSADAGEGGSYERFCTGEARGMRIGVPREYLSQGLAPDIRGAFSRALSILEGMGAKVEEFSMPSLRHVVPAYYLISSAEASSNLARYDGIKYGHRAQGCRTYSDLVGRTRAEGFGREVKRRILLGTYALASGYYDAYYKKALQLRTVIKKEFDAAFERYDVIFSPTTPTTAYRLGEGISDPLALYLADIYTAAQNIAGLPAISVPFGRDSQGLPIGLSFTGRAFGERAVLRAASALESAHA